MTKTVHFEYHVFVNIYCYRICKVNVIFSFSFSGELMGNGYKLRPLILHYEETLVSGENVRCRRFVLGWFVGDGQK